jgi:hypothetical protein
LVRIEAEYILGLERREADTGCNIFWLAYTPIKAYEQRQAAGRAARFFPFAARNPGDHPMTQSPTDAPMRLTPAPSALAPSAFP